MRSHVVSILDANIHGTGGRGDARRRRRWGVRTSVTIVAANRACDDVSLRTLLRAVPSVLPLHRDDVSERLVAGPSSRGVTSFHCFLRSVSWNLASFLAALLACSDLLILFIF